MKLTVYRILDTSNGKMYIGSTIHDFESRLQAHKQINKGWNRGLCDWYPDINPDDLVGEVLEVIEDPSEEEVRLRLRESYYCNYYRNLGYELYNKRLDATHHSEESRAKISKSSKGRKCSELSRASLIEYNETQMSDNRHQFHHVVRYMNQIYEGSTELHAKLVSEGYDLTYHQVNNLVGGFFSRKNRSRYPELLSLIEVIQ